MKLLLRSATGLAVAALALAGCATEQAADDPGAAPPATATSSDAPDTPTSAPTSVPPDAGMCAPDQPDCVDTAPDGDAPPAAGTCLEGATECADFPGSEAPGPPDDLEPVMVEPAANLDDVRAVTWVDVQPDESQTSLTVSWWGGNEDCYGLDRVEVDETADAVTLTVFTGRQPDVDICTDEAVLTATTVDLDDELGPRSILDGAESTS